ncbi:MULTISPECIES: ABC transporter permease [unclassified Rathayibacter]|uniref:ABC transporter permease n=1 Tax=unclassified Rathayibacter TaxID=2609250 RepID=UPI00188A9772|nr:MULTISPECIES: ABC transporter permease [unclassified Rathayibacter]MBF4461219.1 ABC transporter permease [Rathayibacter sp. VKM Ac-2879]MBF4502630.1 ABC transporter permease [Rathayibacter sp. VKM Ac-2878]
MPRDVTSTEPPSRAREGAEGRRENWADSARAGEEFRRLASGLDRLQTDGAARAGRWRAAAARVAPPVVFLLLAVTAWQLAVVLARPRPDVTPGPFDVLAALVEGTESGRVQLAVATSLERGVLGFVIAIVAGTLLGLLLAEVRLLRRAVGPIVSGLQSLPSVAWVPAAILWFGLSDATVYFVILTGAVPSIANGLLAGIDQVPPRLRQVGIVLGAGRVRLVTDVVLPAALPGYVSGLKQGWAFSWRSLMAAEIIATGGSIGFGLGALLDQSRQLADIAGVFAAILLILFVGVLVELLVFGPVERRILRRRGLAPGGAR